MANKPGRPTALSPDEEAAVLSTFQKSRLVGAKFDRECFQLIGAKVVAALRKSAVTLSKGWVQSFIRRFAIGRMRCLSQACVSKFHSLFYFRTVTSDRPPSTQPELKDDNEWRAKYKELVSNPMMFNIAAEEVPACLQWACDETPVQYGAACKRTYVSCPGEAQV